MKRKSGPALGGLGFILGSAYTPPWLQKGSCPGLALLVVALGDQ